MPKVRAQCVMPASLSRFSNMHNARAPLHLAELCQHAESNRRGKEKVDREDVQEEPSRMRLTVISVGVIYWQIIGRVERGAQACGGQRRRSRMSVELC